MARLARHAEAVSLLRGLESSFFLLSPIYWGCSQLSRKLDKCKNEPAPHGQSVFRRKGASSGNVRLNVPRYTRSGLLNCCWDFIFL